MIRVDEGIFKQKKTMAKMSKKIVYPAATFALALTLLLTGCGDKQPPLSMFSVPPDTPHAEVAKPCADQNPQRNAYFGDLHVHTAFSADATDVGLRLEPDDAYRYAFGQEVDLPPYDEKGQSTRRVKIDRPLDFAAVTDHAEFLGETAICTDPKHAKYDTGFCEMRRANAGISLAMAKYIISPITWRPDKVCGKDSSICFDASRSRWQQTIAAAERWNDNTDDCQRTAFIGYEYSSYRLAANLHRNVIFRNSAVPALPVSYIEAPREWELWRLLKEGCKESASGCDVLAIPHNSNISNGRMFNVDYIGTSSKQERIDRARLQIEMEPIVEIMQHKGDSECRNGMAGVLNSEDELCEFEKFADLMSQLRSGGKSNIADDICFEGLLGDSMLHLGPGCISWSNYVRYALIEGLRQEQELGVNPLKYGITASTDTHNGTAGAVEERSFSGHLGTSDDSVAKRAAWDKSVRGNVVNGPGGLVGVWAEQNNRDALFDAMQRKEVFGTSGPRIMPRFFGGWDLPADLCDNADGIATAYNRGVPMGGDLSGADRQQRAAVFMAAATADSGTASAPGNPLQRLQIIKGWVDASGQRHERVFDVAGDPNNGASVDTNTCATSGSGYAQLCTVWRDPEFDANTHAVYYLRAVENPSCRFNAWQCVGLEGEDRPAGCDDTHAPKEIQERAWSSPIWYTP